MNFSHVFNKKRILSALNIAIIFSIPWLIFLPKGNGILELIIFLGGPLYIYFYRKQWLNQTRSAWYLLGLMGVFSLSAWFSLVITEGPLTGTNSFRSEILKFFLLFSVVGLVLSKNKLEKYMGYGFLSITLFATACGYLYLMGFQIFEVYPYSSESHPFYDFFQSFGQHKNQFAYFLNFYTWITAGFFIFSDHFQKKYIKPLVLLTLFFSSMGIWLSGVRGTQITWLCTLFAFAGIFLLIKGKFKPIVYLLLALFIFTGIFSLVYFYNLPGHTIVRDNIKRLSDFEEYTKWSGRLTTVFPHHLLTIKNNSIWFGAGKENYKQKFTETKNKYQKFFRKHDYFKPCWQKFMGSHNIFIRTWAFYGMIPVFILLVTMIYIIFCTFKININISLMGIPLICLVLINGLAAKLDIYQVSIALGFIWMQLNSYQIQKKIK